MIEYNNSDIINKLEVAQRQYELMKKEYILSKYSIPSHPGKDGFYRVMIKDRTKKSGRSTIAAKSIEQLKDKLYSLEAGNSVQNINSSITFKEAFKHYQEDKIKYTKNKSKQYSVQNTIGKYKSDYKRFFDGSGFENLYINDISKKEIENVIFKILKQNSIRKKTFESIKYILRNAFKYAENEDYISKNPYTKINFDKFLDMIEPEIDIKKRYHSDEDIERILDEIHIKRKSNPQYIPAYALEFQILTGMRRGEIPPLKWADVTDNYIYICKEQITVKKYNNIPEHDEIVEHTKTNKNRYFPITQEINNLFTELKNNTPYPKSQFIFPANNTNGCISNNVVYQYYRRICNKLGIIICKDIIKGTHAFRRTRITEFINKSNGNIIMAAELFGNSPEIARKHYYTGVNLEDARMILQK